MNPIKALGYSASEKIIRAIINIIFLAFLGRILLPEELGVFVILWAIYQLLQSFFGSTLVNAYLRSDKSINTTQTIFGASIIFSITGFLIFWLLQPLVKTIFSISFDQNIYFFISIVLFLLPINSFLRGILQGRSDFDKIAIVESFALIISVFIGIFFLVHDYGIIALSIKYFTESIILFFVYIFILKLRTKFKFDLFSKEIMPLLKYSLGISSARLSSAVTGNLTSLFVGYFFALQYVAYFSYSMTLAKIPDNLFRTMITSPALTYLGKYKGEALFGRCQLLASVILVFAMIPAILIILNGDNILLILMGPQWDEFTHLFQIMGLFAISQVLKGWLTILYINFMDMISWNKINFLELLITCLFIAVTFQFQLSIHSFVTCFAGIQLCFWASIYILSNYRFAPSQQNFIKRLVDLKLLLIPTLAIIFLIQVEISLYSSTLNVFLSLLLITLVTLTLLVIFERKSFKLLKELIRDLFNA